MKTHKMAYLYVAFLAVLSSILFANQAALTKLLDDWQLLPRPVRLSELYFTNERQLPQVLKVGESQKVTFTLHNLEQQTTTYHYKIVAASAAKGNEQLLGEGTLTLGHNHIQTTDRTVTIPALGTRLAVKVNVEYKGIALGEKVPQTQTQSIFYWARTTGTLGVRQQEARRDS